MLLTMSTSRIIISGQAQCSVTFCVDLSNNAEIEVGDAE